MSAQGFGWVSMMRVVGMSAHGAEGMRLLLSPAGYYYDYYGRDYDYFGIDVE